MGTDSIRHLLRKRLADGRYAYYWNPSKTLKALGMGPEALGTEPGPAKERAVALNTLADGIRLGNQAGGNGPKPGSFTALVSAFKLSDEYLGLKPRTRKDYDYYLGKIELEFGDLPVVAITARVSKDYYKRVRKESGIIWAYHIMWALRSILTWAASEDWIDVNPALLVAVQAPPKRRVIWLPEQADTYIIQAKKDGWDSIVAMVYVFDSIAQSPVDVIKLTRGSYDGVSIDVAREKTGEEGAPIRLLPTARIVLDAYLMACPDLAPEDRMFRHDRLKTPWDEWQLRRVHREIREAAGLPSKLQLQDFRRTAQTEAGAAGGTMDEIRGLARHKTRAAGEHYVIPDARYVNALQDKRLAYREKNGQKDANEAGTAPAEPGKSQSAKIPESE